MLVKVENGIATAWPLAEHYLPAAHPDTSFSFPPSDAVLAHFGYARFVHSDPPEYDAETQEPKELPPLVTGVTAVQQWEIVNKAQPE